MCMQWVAGSDAMVALSVWREDKKMKLYFLGIKVLFFFFFLVYVCI